MSKDMKILRTLKRNKEELLNAEKTILIAIAVDASHGMETEPCVTEKIFEISDLILRVSERIAQCEEKIKKNNKNT